MTYEEVQNATTELVDTIRSTGRITQDRYDAFLQTLSGTGNAYDVELEAQIADLNARKKTTQASATKVGEMKYYSEYNLNIEKDMAENGYYKLKEGDIIIVQVKNTNKTISQILRDFIYQVTGGNTASIVAQHSGIVNVNG